MKSSISLYIAALAILFLSCDDRNTASLAPEYLYDAGNQKVIESIINEKKGTMAILYGDDLALQTACDSLHKLNLGAKYTLVTWKQKPMPQWYGTNINAEIYSVEHVKVARRNAAGFVFDYHFKTGEGYKPGDARPEKSQQIKFITSQRAAVFP